MIRGKTLNMWLTGAGSGIGEALARELIRDGHQLVLTGRQKGPLQELAKAAPERVTPAGADTTDRQSLAQLKPVLERLAPLHMVILNAGTCQYLDAKHFDSQVIEKNVTTNLVGTAHCVELALPHLRAARRQGEPATLVLVSSSAWWFPFGRAEGYGASKAGLSYFAHALRADLASEGIEVVVVSPGFVKTPMTDRNDFPMPFLISAEDAARRIVRGLDKGRREIHFPKRFTWMLKLLGALPQPLVDRLAVAMARGGKRGTPDQ